MADPLPLRRYISFEQEYRAIRDGVGLIDCSRYALIAVGGRERASFLHRLLTNDIARLGPGQGCHAALLDASAKLIEELFVLADENILWLACHREQAKTVAQTLDRYLFTEDVTITAQAPQAVFAIEGPRTPALLAALGNLPALHPSYTHQLISIAEIPVRLIQASVIGGQGSLLFLDASRAPTVWDHLNHLGVPLGLEQVGWDAFNTARIEAGRLWFGIDMDTTNLLPETGLERTTVSDTKGCYLGQEIVARVQTYGSVNKKLVGLTLDGLTVPEAGNLIITADPEHSQELGHVTSGCFSLALKRPIALGYVKRGWYDAGATVGVRRGQQRLQATVTALPFVP